MQYKEGVRWHSRREVNPLSNVAVEPGRNCTNFEYITLYEFVFDVR